MKNDRLPDPDAIARAVKKVGDQFSVRGLEITAEGTLTETYGGLRLTIPGEPVLPLAAITRKVQWDSKKKADHPHVCLTNSDYAMSSNS